LNIISFPSIFSPSNFCDQEVKLNCPKRKNSIANFLTIQFVIQISLGSPAIAHNVWLVAGGQIKTFALSQVIKINKELHTSMTHSPARLPQAFVVCRAPQPLVVPRHQY
jgi:hypothetical protein